jgi:hypothetical protein
MRGSLRLPFATKMITNCGDTCLDPILYLYLSVDYFCLLGLTSNKLCTGISIFQSRVVIFWTCLCQSKLSYMSAGWIIEVADIAPIIDTSSKYWWLKQLIRKSSAKRELYAPGCLFPLCLIEGCNICVAIFFCWENDYEGAHAWALHL